MSKKCKKTQNSFNKLLDQMGEKIIINQVPLEASIAEDLYLDIEAILYEDALRRNVLGEPLNNSQIIAYLIAALEKYDNSLEALYNQDDEAVCEHSID